MAVRGRVTGEESWFRKLKRAAGFRIENSEGAPPTALVDLAKPAYRMGIARIKVGWEGHKLGVKVKADKETYAVRSEEHTSELQSLMRISYAVFCLKKNKQTYQTNT